MQEISQNNDEITVKFGRVKNIVEMALKEAALAKVSPFNKHSDLHYKPSDKLLNFLTSL